MFTRYMGSVHYVAELMKREEKIKAMYALDGLGYFDFREHSQRYPYFLGLFKSNTANFIAFMSDPESGWFLRHSIEIFRLHANYPSEGIIAPSFLNSVSNSDHWSFREKKIPSIVITDTWSYRNRHFKRTTDTIETIDFDSYTHVVEGIRKMLRNLHFPEDNK